MYVHSYKYLWFGSISSSVARRFRKSILIIETYSIDKIDLWAFYKLVNIVFQSYPSRIFWYWWVGDIRNIPDPMFPPCISEQLRGIKHTITTDALLFFERNAYYFALICIGILFQSHIFPLYFLQIFGLLKSCWTSTAHVTSRKIIVFI